MNPFDWIYSKIDKNETYLLSYLCYAFQELKDSYDSVQSSSAVLHRTSDESPSVYLKNQRPTSYEDRTFTPDFNLIMLAELALNADLKNVRIHTGPEADRKSREGGAEAFASGHDIYFREGMYQPDSEEGKNLLIHELQHVTQYQQGRNPDFQEDREVLEYKAFKKEVALSGKEFHHLEGFELSDGKNSFDYKQEQPLIGVDSDIQDFGKKKTEYLRVVDRSGKAYCIKTNERDEVIEKTTELVSQKLQDEWICMNEDEKKRILDNLLGVL
jgi:hypothetical protein